MAKTNNIINSPTVTTDKIKYHQVRYKGIKCEVLKYTTVTTYDPA